jgi:hypothetical protein
MTMGGVFSYEMMMSHDNGMMYNCPYMGITALCDMTSLEHLSQWQQMFAGIVQQFSILALFLLLAVFIILHFVQDLIAAMQSSHRAMYRYRYRET